MSEWIYLKPWVRRWPRVALVLVIASLPVYLANACPQATRDWLFDVREMLAFLRRRR
jgi:hypothetical protein